jgi:hypothetical protein
VGRGEYRDRPHHAFPGEDARGVDRVRDQPGQNESGGHHRARGCEAILATGRKKAPVFKEENTPGPGEEATKGAYRAGHNRHTIQIAVEPVQDGKGALDQPLQAPRDARANELVLYLRVDSSQQQRRLALEPGLEEVGQASPLTGVCSCASQGFAPTKKMRQALMPCA